MAAKVETTTETPVTATTQFGRFLLDRFNVESPQEITLESMESRKGMFLFNKNVYVLTTLKFVIFTH
jgi:hypothetical protein